MVKIIEVSRETRYLKLMEKYEEKCSMTYMLQENRLFQRFPYAQYATDSRLWAANISNGVTFNEAKKY